MRLPDGHFVVSAPGWDSASRTDVGAVTWVRAGSAASGVVSETNSLVGTRAGDRVGEQILVLDNGNFVVGSPSWTSDTTVRAGAATLVDGAHGLVGQVSASNSRVGSSDGESVGNLWALPGGSFLVGAPYWDNPSLNQVNAGALSRCRSACTGIFASTNAMTGERAYDSIGGRSFRTPPALPNGDVLIESLSWRNPDGIGIGAVTYFRKDQAITGSVLDNASILGGPTESAVVFSIAADVPRARILVGVPSRNRVESFDMLSESASVVFRDQFE